MQRKKEKKSTAGLNLEFSFSLTCWFTKMKIFARLFTQRSVKSIQLYIYIYTYVCVCVCVCECMCVCVCVAREKNRLQVLIETEWKRLKQLLNDIDEF